MLFVKNGGKLVSRKGLSKNSFVGLLVIYLIDSHIDARSRNYSTSVY